MPSLRKLQRILAAVLVATVANSVEGQATAAQWTRCQSNDPDASIAACTAIVRLGKDTPARMAVAYQSRATAHEMKGDLASALQDLIRAVRADSANPDYLTNRARLYQLTRDYDRALADFDRSLRLRPSMLAFAGRGAVYFERGDVDRAIADYTQAVRLEPHAVVFYNRGLAFRKKDDLQRAKQDFEQALRLDPTDLATRYQHGHVMLAMGNNAGALEDYDAVVRSAPTDGAALVSRGLAYQRLGDVDRAIADYTQAIRFIPESAIPFFDRGLAFAEKKEPALAQQDFESALQIDSTLAAAWIELGKIHDDAGDYNTSVAEYSRAIALDPSSSEAYFYRGATLLNVDVDRAILDYDQAIRINPNYGDAFVLRGIAHFRKGKRDRALADWTDALDVSGERADALYGRGIVRQLNGQKKEGKADVEAAMRLRPGVDVAMGNFGVYAGSSAPAALAVADRSSAVQAPVDSSGRPAKKMSKWRQLGALVAMGAVAYGAAKGDTALVNSGGNTLEKLSTDSATKADAVEVREAGLKEANKSAAANAAMRSAPPPTTSAPATRTSSAPASSSAPPPSSAGTTSQARYYPTSLYVTIVGNTPSDRRVRNACADISIGGISTRVLGDVSYYTSSSLSGEFQIMATLTRSSMWAPGDYQVTITSATNCGRDGEYLRFDPISSTARVQYASQGAAVANSFRWQALVR